MRLDTPLHDNNARGTKYAVYYASVVTRTVTFEKKNGCTHSVLELKRLSRFPCFFFPRKLHLKPKLFIYLFICYLKIIKTVLKKKEHKHLVKQIVWETQRDKWLKLQ